LGFLFKGGRKMKRLLIVLTLLLVLPCVTFAVDCPIPDTGQTKCYNATTSIPCPSPGQPFYGQDAQYITNTQSYTTLNVNGDIMVQDNVTELIWEVKQDKDDTPDYENPHDADNRYTWYDGDTGTPGDGISTYDTQQHFIDVLNTAGFGGHSDWRMPTVKELSTIVDSSIPNTSPTINTDYFPNTGSSIYWSSTSSVTDPSYAWYVFFYRGSMNYNYGKSTDHCVRAVRGGQCGSFGDFHDNGDETVIDTSTGLMWEVKTDDGGSRDRDKYYTWEEALSYCEDLSLEGYNDWRLPDINELQSIVDYNQYDPSIDPVFLNTVSSLYWSSTSYVGNPHIAWTVHFNHGSMNHYLKSSYYYVRAVRGGQCGSFGDSDGDVICDDGDDNETPGDNPCTGGETVGCDDNCPNDYNPGQEDTSPPGGNGCGDACECEGDFDCDLDQDWDDVFVFLDDWGRNLDYNPCPPCEPLNPPCEGDFDGDCDIDWDDVFVFLDDWGRNPDDRPCPACQ
jgi:hypothetical protein